jgi:5-methylcytosine-specific restriction endonuclease McrA
MVRRKVVTDPQERARILARLRDEHRSRQSGYREQALRLLPKVCAKCGRDFGGPRLRELTVHHKDGNHENNPSDGSNWELLCIHCHENEHSRALDAGWLGDPSPAPKTEAAPLHNPFAGLGDRLKEKK